MNLKIGIGGKHMHLYYGSQKISRMGVHFGDVEAKKIYFGDKLVYKSEPNYIGSEKIESYTLSGLSMNVGVGTGDIVYDYDLQSIIKYFKGSMIYSDPIAKNSKNNIIINSKNELVLTLEKYNTLYVYGNTKDAKKYSIKSISIIFAVDANDNYYLNSSGYITKLNSNFKEVWSCKVPYTFYDTGCIASNGDLYFGNSNRSLIKVDSTGTLAWSKTMDTEIRSVSANDDGTLNVSQKKNLIRLTADGQNILNTYTDSGTISKALTDKYSNIYICDGTNSVKIIDRSYKLKYEIKISRVVKSITLDADLNVFVLDDEGALTKYKQIEG